MTKTCLFIYFFDKKAQTITEKLNHIKKKIAGKKKKKRRNQEMQKKTIKIEYL